MDYAYIERLASTFRRLAQWSGYHPHQHGHKYDPSCRCEECQNREFDIQSKIEEEKQLERDRRERLYGTDENDARTVSLPEQQVTGIPTDDLERVVNHTLDSIKRSADPAFGYWYRTTPVGNGYNITMEYLSGKVTPQQIQSALKQVLSLKWPGTDFTFDIRPQMAKS